MSLFNNFNLNFILIIILYQKFIIKNFLILLNYHKEIGKSFFVKNLSKLIPQYFT